MNFCSGLLNEGTPELTESIFRLFRHGELSGYELACALRKTSSVFRNKGELYLYPALHELERRGLLTSRWRSSHNSGATKYYRLSVLGEYYRSHKKLNPFKYLRERVKQYLCKNI